MADQNGFESRAYKEAMDGLQFSPDFERRTLERLDRELGLAPRRGRGHVLHWTAGIGAVAAALVLAFALNNRPALTPANLTAPTDATAPKAIARATLQPATTSIATDAQLAVGQADVQMEMAEAESVPGAPRSFAAQGAGAAAQPMAGAIYDEYAFDVEADWAPPAPIAPAGNTAEYSHIEESGFTDAATQPLSTFAADVDTASYANVRQLLRAGALPAPDMVRTEEFINYFHYGYPQPTGTEPFSVTTEVGPCPWNPYAKLMLVGLKAKDIDASELPPSNLVFLIDVSGSMDEPNKLPLAQQAFRMVIDSLRPSDRVSIVVYAGTDAVLLDGASGSEKARIADAIDSLFASGSTDGASGITTAYRLAEKHLIPGGNNRVILATDGDLNVGTTSEGELVRLIEEKKSGGVFLSVMGFGQDNLKDNKLEALADHGNGNYSYIDTALEARKVLVEQMGGTFFTVCKDVKLQVEFNPARVSQYRLIGYENRALAARDFNDDAKDGGEIGAGHTVTALYELIPADGPSGAPAELKYQSSQLTGSDEFATIHIRAKAPDGDESQLYVHPAGPDRATDAPSADFRFASAVAEVCMLLRGSEHAGTASYASAAGILEGIDGIRSDPYKDEFAYLVRQLARDQRDLTIYIPETRD